MLSAVKYSCRQGNPAIAPTSSAKGFDRVMLNERTDQGRAIADLTEQFASQVYNAAHLAEPNQLILAQKPDEAIEVLSRLIDSLRQVEAA